MPLPKECKMPDLSYLTKKKAVGAYLLSSLIGSDSNLNQKFILYRKLFVRLADKAIYEYSMAREAVIDQVKNKDDSIYIVSIINHLENCINSLRRLFYLFDRLKNLISFDRMLRRLVDSKNKHIKDIRDSIEHTDGLIFKGEISKGQTIMLDISEDSSEIMIVNEKISTNDLFNLIKQFYEIARELAIYNAPGVDDKSLKIKKRIIPKN